jgi:Mrp family chromosome partitioning ATPase
MSLGLSFSMTHQRTLLIDCDLIGRQLTNTLDARGLPGFAEAMTDGSIRGKLRKPASNLYFLPSGCVGANDPWSLSTEKLKPLFDEARRHFDVIIIDTGPILGSVEASVLAQEVDGVLFTIARDQQRYIVDRAVRRLNSLDAPLEGFIFNRARATDYEGSAYSNGSLRSVSAAERAANPAATHRSEKLDGFGPLVQAVASTISEESNGAASGANGKAGVP